MSGEAEMNDGEKYKNYIAPLAVVVFSVLWGCYVLGSVPLDIKNTSWLQGDLAQVYLAWSQYLSDPDAMWLMSNRMSYPLDMNFALFDPMPILLLAFRYIADLIPVETQFFGIYFLACLILQGLFGYLAVGEIVQMVRQRSEPLDEAIKVIGGVFFILAPYTYYRFQAHTALSSQWLLVLSIWLALHTRHTSNGRWLMANCGAIFLTTGFNPYLAFMVGFSSTVFTLADSLRPKALYILLRIACLALTALVGLYIFGFLSAANVQSGGYGFYSMNMLGPIDSNGLANLLTFDGDDATGGQSWEGFTYLGLGVILLIGMLPIFLIHLPSMVSMPLKAASAVIVVSYVLALSSTVSLSNETVSVSLPGIIETGLSQFRSSGRLFWIGGFWLIIAGIALVVSRLDPKRATMSLAILLGIQIADVAGIGKHVRQSISTFHHLEFSPSESGVSSEGYEALIVIPPWQCDNQATPGGIRNYESFGFFVANHDIPTNNFYAARTLPGQAEYHCDYDGVLGKVSAKNLYVISPSIYERYASSLSKSLSCFESINPKGAYICAGTSND